MVGHPPAYKAPQCRQDRKDDYGRGDGQEPIPYRDRHHRGFQPPVAHHACSARVRSLMRGKRRAAVYYAPLSRKRYASASNKNRYEFCCQGTSTSIDKEPLMTKQPSPQTDKPQDDDQAREQQRSHGDQQNRSKKDGHTDQIGTGQDQTSGRQRGGAARRPG